MKARMVDREIQSDLPAQIEPHRLHRPLSREPVAIRQQKHLGKQARRDRRATVALAIAVREVPIAHDPIAMLGKQRVDRVLGKQLRTPRRIEEPLLPIHHP